jgi:hypothetical protein
VSGSGEAIWVMVKDQQSRQQSNSGTCKFARFRI